MVWDRTNRPFWLRCTLGILFAVIAAAIRWQFLESLGLRVTFLTFYPAVAVAAIYGGFIAGLLATAVSAVLANYFWMEPVGQSGISNVADLLSIVIFLASGALISYLADVTYRAQARAHKAEERSQLAAERERAAVALQQSESKYRELVENANSAIIRWKKDGAIAFFNEYAQNFFGYGAEEVIGKHINILLPERESTGASLTDLFQKVVNYPERYVNNVNENVLRDGSRVWMAWTNRPIFDRDGQVLEILSIGSDITERKRMEHEREIAVELLELINNSTGTADLVRAAATFFQKQSGCEAVGIRLKKGEDFPYFEARGFPEEFVQLENSLCAKDASGEILRDSAGDPYIECMCGNVICRRIDPAKPFFTPGGSFWANDTTRLLASTSDADRQTRTRNRCNGEGYESVALIPLRLGPEPFGLLQLNDRQKGMFPSDIIALWERLAGYLAIALSKYRTDEALRESEEKYRALFDHMNDIMAVDELLFDEHGNACDWRVLDVNPAYLRALGRPRTDIVGRRASEIYGDDPLKSFLRRFTDIVQTGESVRFEQYFEPLRMHLFVSGFHLGGMRFATVTTDISNRKRMEEELRESRDELELRVEERTDELKTLMAKLKVSNQALQDFASIASHDLQEPLRKVMSFGNLIGQKYKDSLGETGNDYLRRMLDATERMRSLLKGLLEYSRITTKADPFVEVDLTKIVGEVLSDLEIGIERTGAEMRVLGLPIVKADPTQMRQLFQNLIGNALKFHQEDEKPVIEVRSSIADDKLQIVVEDKGIGFEEQYLEKIFAPFQRLHGRSSGYEGTGMGLAICKKIVDRHGGSITAKSTPGKGSSFAITLPFEKKPRKEKSPGPTSS